MTSRSRLASSPLFVVLPCCLALTPVSGCAEDLKPSDQDDSIFTGGDGKLITTRNDDGTYTSHVDATANDTWTALDFDRGVELLESEPGWDVALRRFELRLQTPQGSAPAAQIMQLGDIPLSDAATLDGGVWMTDAPGDLAFERGDGWYVYDPATHVLTARPLTWMLRTDEGALRALRIESYYDDRGTAARLRLRWKPVRGATLALKAAP